MGISERDYVRGKHPPSCTCKECTEKRLARFPKNQNPIRTIKNSARRIPNIFPRALIKCILSLLIIVGIVDIIRRGYTLFTQQIDPLTDTAIFLGELGLWIGVIAILRSRKYKYTRPKFKLIITTVLVITLVCAFAGIEPLVTYKNVTQDYLVENVGGWFSNISFTSSNPSGTYTCTTWGIEQSITFKGSTVEFYNVLDGKRVFKYSISPDGSSLTLRNVSTGKTHTQRYKYIKEHQIVTLGEYEYHRK